MTVFELMSKLGAAGIKLWLEEEQLKFKAPKGALTKDLKDELVAKKADVIEFLKATRVGEEEEASIPLADRKRPLKLSHAQKRLWFVEQLVPGNSTFHIPAALYLRGILDRNALESAFVALIERHESLRTVFTSKKDEPIQIVQAKPNFHLVFNDLTGVKGEEQKAELAKIAQADIAQSFNLETGPLLRARLIKLDENLHGLTVVMHHIVTDGWSMGVFVKEIAALYAHYQSGQPLALEPLKIQYPDFAQWQRGWLTGDLL
ncbi:MAG: condensation domain-containing protein, partial [Pseudomonadales bacterium]|nr:condensation domain-containing protein [Pseudomonadales bacterium]